MSESIPTPLPNSITGDKLHPDDQKHVLAANQSRFTRTRMPDWAKNPSGNDKKPALQFEDDADWLAHTEFRGIDENGRIKRGRWSAKSTPSYPDNPELRPGYVAPEPGAEPVEAIPEPSQAAQPAAPQKAEAPKPFAW